MKAIISSKGKTCKPRLIPENAKLTTNELQKAHDEVADQYEKKIWFDRYPIAKKSGHTSVHTPS